VNARRPSATTSQFRLRTDYAAYPVQPGSESITRILEQLQVRGVSAVHYRCAAHWTMPRRKAGADTLLLVLDGRGQVSIDERDYRISPGRLVQVQMGSRLAAVTDPDAPLSFLLIHATATVAGAVPVGSVLGFPDLLTIPLDHPVRSLLEEACRACALRPPGWERGCEALVLMALLELVRGFGALLAPLQRPRALAGITRLLPALDAMRTDLATPLPMPDLARRAGLSQPQFRRVFHQVLGCSPVAYLRRLRMEEACRMLRQGGFTIDQVSRAVGYAEPAFFHRTFTRLIGVTPGRWREQGV
jgi:AraC-like DNA-binding protein/quercetin dioxygenase-like cupin family protein